MLGNSLFYHDSYSCFNSIIWRLNIDCPDLIWMIIAELDIETLKGILDTPFFNVIMNNLTSEILRHHSGIPGANLNMFVGNTDKERLINLLTYSESIKLESKENEEDKLLKYINQKRKDLIIIETISVLLGYSKTNIKNIIILYKLNKETYRVKVGDLILDIPLTNFDIIQSLNPKKFILDGDELFLLNHNIVANQDGIIGKLYHPYSGEYFISDFIIDNNYRFPPYFYAIDLSVSFPFKVIDKQGNRIKYTRYQFERRLDMYDIGNEKYIFEHQKIPQTKMCQTDFNYFFNTHQTIVRSSRFKPKYQSVKK